VLRYLVISVLFPYIANEAGWFTAECGRQPWIVYHLLRTSKGVSLSITPGQVLGSLIMFVCIYALLFALFIFLLNRKIQGGPSGASEYAADEYRAHI
jgi:cytochrome d ubiquinol oxidase subunit I